MKKNKSYKFPKFQITAYVILILLIVLTGCYDQGEKDSTNVTYNRVTKNKEIRAAYFIADPYLIKDPKSGKISGIFGEVLDSIGAKLGYKISWTIEVGFSDMAEGLRTGKYDVVGSGVWINSARGKVADFTTPIFYDAVGVYVRKDDERFNQDLSLVNNTSITVSTIDGEMAATIAKQDFPSAKTLSIPPTSDLSLMLKNVAEKKADITFIGLGPGNNYITKNPNSLKNIAEEKPIRVFATSIMVGKSEYDLTQTLNFAIMDLENSGTIDRIIQKYDKGFKTHIRVAKPYQSVRR
ncbi:substrate-binding periplasmic protein [Mucilaginibacter galii]|nr:transporter substrate-binding domain-containing protein [Mucilaginibacter galii]